jgi:hypothetical protein
VAKKTADDFFGTLAERLRAEAAAPPQPAPEAAPPMAAAPRRWLWASIIAAAVAAVLYFLFGR